MLQSSYFVFSLLLHLVYTPYIQRKVCLKLEIFPRVHISRVVTLYWSDVLHGEERLMVLQLKRGHHTLTSFEMVPNQTQQSALCEAESMNGISRVRELFPPFQQKLKEWLVLLSVNYSANDASSWSINYIYVCVGKWEKVSTSSVHLLKQDRWGGGTMKVPEVFLDVVSIKQHSASELHVLRQSVSYSEFQEGCNILSV